MGIGAAIASYDGISNQMGWPKIPALWGMTGYLLPWWGWLLLTQGILVLALFEYVRRNSDVSAEQPGVSDERLREIAEQVLTSIWHETVNPTIRDSLAAKLVVVERDLFAQIDERFDSQIKQIATQAGEFAGFKAETEKRLLMNDYALAAMGHREVLLKYAADLESGSDSLDLAVRGGSLLATAEWNDWERDYKTWRSQLEHWLIFASPYSADIELVKKLPDNIHKLRWTFGDSHFPNSAAIHEYRSFCVILHNWNEIKNKVHTSVRKVAFEGQLPRNAKV